MGVPDEGVHFDGRQREHVVVLVLAPSEAEMISLALGSRLRGYRDLIHWASQARALDASVAWVPVGVPNHTPTEEA